MKANPKIAFAVISLENPLQAYIYYRQRDSVVLKEAINLIGLGSLYCAVFWGVIIDIAVVIWNLTISMFNTVSI